MLDLIDVFHRLAPPSAEASILRFTAVPIPGFERHHLGKDAQGAPALLIAVNQSQGNGWPAPIVLEHLTVQHDIECRISRPEDPIIDGRFTVVRCTAAAPTLNAYFLQVVGALVSLLGQRPSRSDVMTAMDGLVELFRAMGLPGRKSIQGLWAELLLIARTRAAVQLVRAWHVLPGDRYDFSAGAQRIEVKSALGRTRQHYFSLDQLLPVPGTEVLIASVLVERAGAGPSVVDLAEEIRDQIRNAPDLLLHLDRVIGFTLGENLRYATEEHFDRELAERSLVFFDSGAVPKVNPILPASVSDVRFSVDLSSASAVDVEEYREHQGIFACALRR